MFFGVYGTSILLKGITIGVLVLDKGMRLILPATIGAVIYIFVAYLFKIEEVHDIIIKIKKRKNSV